MLQQLKPNGKGKLEIHPWVDIKNKCLKIVPSLCQKEDDAVFHRVD